MKSLFYWGLAISIVIFIFIGPGAFILGTLVISQGTQLIKDNPYLSTVIVAAFFLSFIVPVLVVRKIIQMSRQAAIKAKERLERRRRKTGFRRYRSPPKIAPVIIDAEYTEVD